MSFIKKSGKALADVIPGLGRLTFGTSMRCLLSECEGATVGRCWGNDKDGRSSAGQ